MITSPGARARARPSGIRLPPTIRACLFDLDGVLTNTARVHAAAWKETFDAVLRARAGEAFVPFDPISDYLTYVDGKERFDGVRSFLASRDIELDEGAPDDSSASTTVRGIGNRKHDLVLELIHRDGVEAFEGSVLFVRAARDAGLECAVVSASSNCREVLEAAGIADLFEVRVDGLAAERGYLRGKPAADMYLAAASALGVPPGAAAVFEDALAGVEAGASGRFGLVVGVDRIGHAEALRAAGADLVVSDLAELVEPA